MQRTYGIVQARLRVLAAEAARAKVEGAAAAKQREQEGGKTGSEGAGGKEEEDEEEEELTGHDPATRYTKSQFVHGLRLCLPLTPFLLSTQHQNVPGDGRAEAGEGGAAAAGWERARAGAGRGGGAAAEGGGGNVFVCVLFWWGVGILVGGWDVYM